MLIVHQHGDFAVVQFLWRQVLAADKITSFLCHY